MSGADFFVVVAIGILVWAGFSRGVVKEFFELLIVTVDVLISTYLYGFVADLLVQYAHVPSLIAATFSYLLFFAGIAFALWVAAGKAEAFANIPPKNEFNQIGGFLLSFCKAVIIIWGLLLLIGQIPMEKGGKAFFHDSWSVRKIQQLNPYFDEAFHLLGSERTYSFIHPRIKQSVF